MAALAVAMGVVVGLSLGLTGGGGAIFAVPLLVYGLGVPAKDAVMISLAAVGMISLIGFWVHWREGKVELRTGLIFAAAGMIGAPLGTWIAARLSESVLLLGFAGLMATVAFRLWQQADRAHDIPGLGPKAEPDCHPALACQRNPAGDLLLTSRCAVLLLVIGLLAGVLSGLFGVGGGFIVVPALVLYSGMPIRRAIGTSLLVIVLVSFAGVASHLLAGRTLMAPLTLGFVVGGIGGLFAGQRIGRSLPPPLLQKTFVVAILLVALFMLARHGASY